MATKIAAAVAGEPAPAVVGASRGSSPARRIILLGASNLTNGFGTVMRRLQGMFQEPLEIVAAYGHGRSYGMYSKVMGRMLPGIDQCGLWSELGRRPALPSCALVTDIGNDIMYQAPVDQIAGWLESCLDRLARLDVRIAVTELPVVNLPKLRDWQYTALRTFLFPSCRLSLTEIKARASTLNEHVHRLARERGLLLVRQNSNWYGLDPIHVLKRYERTAWERFLAPLCESPSELPANGQSKRPRAIRTISGYALAPEQRWLFGRELRRRQPSCRWPDGTTFSIY